MKRVYCIPRLNQIEDFLTFSQEYNAGFEYNDFFIPDILDDEAEVTRRIEAYKALDRDRSEDTLHGVFLDIVVHSADKKILAASDYRIRQSMDIAMRLGVKAVIFHTNFIPNFKTPSYLDGFVNQNEVYWRKLLQDYPDLCVYIENMFDMEADLLARLAERMADEPRFGVCYDIAHANIGTEDLPTWNQKLAPYVKHMHLNDNDGFADMHKAIGSSSVDWASYQALIDAIPEERRPSVLIEVNSFADTVASVQYMQEHKLYPFS